jgi:hypothetical protein
VLDFLPAAFAAEIKAGAITLEIVPSPPGSTLEIYTYQPAAKSSYPAGIFNAGRAYPNARQGKPVNESDVFRLPKRAADFVRAMPELRGELRVWNEQDGLEVFLTLPTAETTSPSVSESASWLLLDTSLEFDCGGKIMNIPLAEFIGTKIRIPLKPAQVELAKARLLAPLRRKFPAACAGKITGGKLLYGSAYRTWLDIQFAEFPAGEW